MPLTAPVFQVLYVTEDPALTPTQNIPFLALLLITAPPPLALGTTVPQNYGDPCL